MILCSQITKFMKRLKNNIGTVDKYLRVTGIIILLFLYNYFHSDWFLFIGIVLSLTVVMGWCPLYSITGIKTCKKENKENNIY
jgi:hypothetical protein